MWTVETDGVARSVNAAGRRFAPTRRPFGGVRPPV